METLPLIEIQCIRVGGVGLGCVRCLHSHSERREALMEGDNDCLLSAIN